MRIRRTLMLAVALCSLAPRAAFADITGFIGTTTTPANRALRGFAFGAGLLVVGVEFEYADTTEDPMVGAPSLRTGMGNVLLQTPFAILGFQPYVTTGGGLYREQLGSHEDPSVGFNTAGGAQISALGPGRRPRPRRAAQVR